MESPRDRPTKRPAKRPSTRGALLALLIALALFLMQFLGPTRHRQTGEAADDGARIVQASLDSGGKDAPVQRFRVPRRVPWGAQATAADQPGNGTALLIDGPCFVEAAIQRTDGGPASRRPYWLVATHAGALSPGDPSGDVLSRGRTDDEGHLALTSRRPPGSTARLVVEGDGGALHCGPTFVLRPWTLVTAPGPLLTGGTVVNVTVPEAGETVHWQLLPGRVATDSGPRLGFVGAPAEPGPHGVPWPRGSSPAGGSSLSDRGVGAGAWELAYWSASHPVAFAAVPAGDRMTLTWPTAADPAATRPTPTAPTGDVCWPAIRDDVTPVLLRLDERGDIDEVWALRLDLRPLEPRFESAGEDGVRAARVAVPSGRYAVHWRGPDGAFRAAETIDVGVGGRVDLAVPAAVLPRRLIVQVRNADDAAPIAAARVVVMTGRAALGAGMDVARTDAAGRAEIVGLPPGEFVVGVWSSAGGRVESTVTIPEDPAMPTVLSLSVAKGVSLGVTVVDSDGRPIPEFSVVAVSVVGDVSSAKSDSEGRATFASLAPGLHALMGTLGRLSVATDSWDWLAREAGALIVDTRLPDSGNARLVMPRPRPVRLDIALQGVDAGDRSSLQIVHAGTPAAPGLWPDLLFENVKAGLTEIDRLVPGRYRAIATWRNRSRLADLDIGSSGGPYRLSFDFSEDLDR